MEEIWNVKNNHNARKGGTFYQTISFAKLESSHKNKKCCRGHVYVDVLKQAKNHWQIILDCNVLFNPDFITFQLNVNNPSWNSLMNIDLTNGLNIFVLILPRWKKTLSPYI